MSCAYIYCNKQATREEQAVIRGGFFISIKLCNDHVKKFRNEIVESMGGELV